MRHADRVKAFVEAERQQRAARRQELLRDYGREIPQESERDAAIERDQHNHATEDEVGASVKPTGAGRTPDGQGQQPQKSAGRQSHAAAGDGRAGAAAPRVGQVVRVSGVRLSVFVDRQAEAKAAATIGEEAERAAWRQRRTGVAPMATDADQSAETWACRRQA